MLLFSICLVLVVVFSVLSFRYDTTRFLGMKEIWPRRISRGCFVLFWILSLFVRLPMNLDNPILDSWVILIMASVLTMVVTAILYYSIVWILKRD